MIRALRRRHRRMIALLAVAVPALFAAGIVVRPPEPTVPAVVLEALERPVAVARWTDGLWHGARVRTGLARVDGRSAWVLEFPRDPEPGGVLLYWVPRVLSEPLDTLPSDAVLLGPPAPGRSLVRRAEAGPGATLVLYVPSTGDVAGWAVLPGERPA